MPNDKYKAQMSENDTQIANDATAKQGQTYADQGKPGSSSNRAHADFSYANNIGGNDYIKPTPPDPASGFLGGGTSSERPDLEPGALFFVMAGNLMGPWGVPRSGYHWRKVYGLKKI